MFPTVEEYLLLDVLSNSDNNVQKAAERLVKMGYVSIYLFFFLPRESTRFTEMRS